MLEDFIELFLMGLVFWSIFIVWKQTRSERIKRKFQKKIKEEHNAAKDLRNIEAQKLEKQNICDLVKIINQLIDEHKRDITPRQLDQMNKNIQSYVDSLNFDKLYALYELLLESNKNNVYENIKNFRM